MLQQLKTITKQTGDALAMQVDAGNTAEVISKINILTSLLGSSCYAMALAEMMYNEKMQQLTEDSTWLALSATDKKLVFAGRARTELFYYTLTGRQNKAIIHTLDGLKAMIGVYADR